MLKQSFTACVPWLMAARAFGLGRTCQSSPQPLYHLVFQQVLKTMPVKTV